MKDEKGTTQIARIHWGTRAIFLGRWLGHRLRKTIPLIILNLSRPFSR